MPAFIMCAKGNHMSLMKQIILVRKDLKMRRGKEIAQGAHASLAAVLPHQEHPSVKAWLDSSFRKITVKVNSEEELLAAHQKAQAAGLVCSLIKDQGHTEFHGVPTYTTAAIGPASADELDPITGELELY